MFTVQDKDGIPVTLTKETWFGKLLNPRGGHPEIREYLQDIKRTIEDPDFIYQSIRDQKLYKAGLTSGKYRRCYVLVIVKYLQEVDGLHGYVSTTMLTDHIKKRGGLLWQKSTN